ncbi:MAG: hypothetical protein ACLRXB_05055 [Escherichia coli]
MLQPTRKHHWQHQMTCFRDSHSEGKIVSDANQELAQLRELNTSGKEKRIMRRMSKLNAGNGHHSVGELYLNFGNALALHLNDDGIQLQRRSLAGQRN